MTRSLEEGFKTTPGRNPKNPEQEFDESRSINEALDDRGTVQKILSGAHETATSKAGKTTAFTAGALYIFEEAATQSDVSGELNEIVTQAGEVAAQYPEASTGALAVAGALTAYNAAEESGLIETANEGIEYVRESLSEVDEGYEEITDEAVNEDLGPIGIEVDSDHGPEEVRTYSDKSEYDPSS